MHEGDPGDSLHLIDKGRVAVRTSTPMGDVVTFNVLGPGDNFGELSLIPSDTRRSATIVAMEPTETLTLGHAEFDELRIDHRIGDVLATALAARVRELSHLLAEAHFVSADTRVLRRLVLLCEVYDTSAADIVVPVTQHTLATMAGTTRPTANRVLRGLEADGLVTLARGRVTVHDTDALRRRAR